MKLVILAAFLCVTYGARLENTYLPPSGATGAGGGPGLAAPRGNGGGAGGQGGPYGQPGGGRNGLGGGAGNGAPGPDAMATILSFENTNNGDGSYKYSYETSNGIKAEEEGELKDANPAEEESGIQSVKGSYSYTAPDGTVITVEYTADENGFVPKGDHLPTPPPIPVEIQKALDMIAANGNGGNGYPAAGNGGGKFNGYQY